MKLSRRTTLAGLAALPAGLARPGLLRAKPPQTGPIRPLAYTDQGGRPDGVQVMVSGKTLYVGHMFSNGLTVIDVADPTQPRPLQFIAAPANTRTHHLQSNGDLLLVACGADVPTIGRYNPAVSYYEQSFASGMKGKADFQAGLKVFDISRRAEPREIAFLDLPGIGVNRLWFAGGRYAYVSAHLDGFTDHLLIVVDMQEPTRPDIAGRWWMPGMWRDGGETPGWTGKRVALHHMIVAGTTGYAAWRDGGFTILDVADPANIQLVAHRNTAPPYPGGTHTTLPLPARQLVAVLDESSSLNCAKGLSYTWLFDVRNPANPVSVATLPTPSDQAWCRPGQNFGPHNLHENRPESLHNEDLLFATYHNAGLRIFNIGDPFVPREIGSFVPPPPTRILDPRPGNALAPQSCDINVQSDGIMYLTDWNGGMHILEFVG